MSKAIDPEKKVAKPSLPGEQRFAVVGSLNQPFVEAVNRAAKRYGVEKVVMLEDDIAVDTFQLREKPEYDDKKSAQQVVDYVKNANERKAGADMARKLWDILTNGNVPIDDHAKKFFTQAQVAKYTNLSHSKAEGTLKSLSLLGYIRWTGTKDKGFQFMFTEDEMLDHLEVVVLNNCRLLTSVLARYRGTVESHPGLSKAQQKEKLDRLIELCDEHVVF